MLQYLELFYMNLSNKYEYCNIIFEKKYLKLCQYFLYEIFFQFHEIRASSVCHPRNKVTSALCERLAGWLAGWPDQHQCLHTVSQYLKACVQIWCILTLIVWLLKYKTISVRFCFSSVVHYVPILSYMWINEISSKDLLWLGLYFWQIYLKLLWCCTQFWSRIISK